MYCIEQGGTSDGLCADETHAHLLQILCHRHSKLGPLTEPDKKELIFRIGNLQKLASSSTDFRILFRMLLLASRRKPTESGASSLLKCVILCSTPSSKSRNSSFFKPVTDAPSGVVTWTGIMTSGTSTRRSARGSPAEAATGLARARGFFERLAGATALDRPSSAATPRVRK